MHPVCVCLKVMLFIINLAKVAILRLIDSSQFQVYLTIISLQSFVTLVIGYCLIRYCLLMNYSRNKRNIMLKKSTNCKSFDKY